MIDWATIKPSISSQIATITGLAPAPNGPVRFVDEPGGQLAGISPLVWLRIDNIVTVGVDREVRTDNGTGQQTVTVVGDREFTLKVRVESFTPDIADPKHAANVGEAIKTRLKRSTSAQARAGIWGVREVLATKKLEYVEANRPITAYLVDVLCCTVDNDVDATTGVGDWIGEVQGSGTVKQQDGTTIDAPTFDATYLRPPTPR
jgi:hypothetical protein